MDSHQVSDAELEVMKVLWQRHPRSSAEIIQALESQGWSDSTVKTLLSRLVKKEALGIQEEANRHLYFPRLSQEDFALQKGREMARLLSGGPALPVALHFLKNADLSARDLVELKKMLEEKTHD